MCFGGIDFKLSEFFFVNNKGIELDKKKTKTILDAKALSTKKNLESLLREIFFTIAQV